MDCATDAVTSSTVASTIIKAMVAIATTESDIRDVMKVVLREEVMRDLRRLELLLDMIEI